MKTPKTEQQEKQNDPPQDEPTDQPDPRPDQSGEAAGTTGSGKNDPPQDEPTRLPDLPTPEPADAPPNPRSLFDAVRFLLDYAARDIGPGDIASTAMNHKTAVDKLEADAYPDFKDPLDPQWPALQGKNPLDEFKPVEEPTDDSKRSAALGKTTKPRK